VRVWFVIIEPSPSAVVRSRPAAGWSRWCARLGDVGEQFGQRVAHRQRSAALCSAINLLAADFRSVFEPMSLGFRIRRLTEWSRRTATNCRPLIEWSRRRFWAVSIMNTVSRRPRERRQQG
jgi:hypothetical protein